MAKNTGSELLTQADIEAGYESDWWLGHGYLGERQNAGFREDTAADRKRGARECRRGDKIALRVANEIGMTRDEFNEWLNSKTGRFYGDRVFGGFNDTDESLLAIARQWGVVR